MIATVRNIAAGVGGAVATAVAIQLHCGPWWLIVLSVLGAVVAVGVSCGQVRPRIAGAAICGIVGVLLGLGCDDTSGIVGIPGAMVGFVFCRTGWALVLGIVATYGGLLGLAAFPHTPGGSWLINVAPQLFCLFGLPLLGLELGNFMSYRLRMARGVNDGGGDERLTEPEKPYLKCDECAARGWWS